MSFRDRIVELRRVPAAELKSNPANWRRHPKRQREAMEAVLREVGYAGALLARETDEGLLLIDGHLRKDVADDQPVPVLILDVNEEEAAKLLATYDPISSMFEADGDQLAALLDGVQSKDDGVNDLLDSVRRQYGAWADDEPQDPRAFWDGMPQYENEDLTPERTIKVHFRSQEDAQAFAAFIGQHITDKTQFLWYPKAEKEVFADKSYVSRSDE